jgi:hypothetical protein
VGTSFERYYCFQCLRVGHFWSTCRCPITCQLFLSPGHVASNYRPSSANMGFQSKVAPLDSFQRKDWDKGKQIDVTAGFKGTLALGPHLLPYLRISQTSGIPWFLLTVTPRLLCAPSLPSTTRCRLLALLLKIQES